MEAYESYLTEQGLAPTTIKNHLRNLRKYKDSFSIEADEARTIQDMSSYPVGSKRQTIATTLSKYRTYKKYPNEQIVLFLKGSSLQTLAGNKITSDAKSDVIPTVKELKAKMDSYYDNREYRSYVIMYLLLNLNVRNLDLDAIITTTKPNDTDRNYLFLRPASVQYIRNRYKTFDTYGQLVHTLKTPNLLTALKQMSLLKLKIINDPSNATRLVKMVTGGFTEADLFKRVVSETIGAKRLKQIGENRGTSVSTITESYAIDQKN